MDLRMLRAREESENGDSDEEGKSDEGGGGIPARGRIPGARVPTAGLYTLADADAFGFAVGNL